MKGRDEQTAQRKKKNTSQISVKEQKDKNNFKIKGRRMEHTIKGRLISYRVPQDIIPDILSRLSVKVLLRFKCVCKGWKDWIESPEFVTLHYDNMSTKRKSLILSSLCQAVVSTVSSGNLEVSRYVEFPFFEDKKDRSVRCFYGPCNGVWCLYDVEYSCRLTTGNDINYSSIGNNIALWNPATRELKALPKSCTRGPHLQDMSIPHWFQVNIGFVYDKNTKDYKVVKISEFNFTLRQRDSWVEVYSLSNDHWRHIEATVPISISSTTDSSSASLEGIHYWSFDLFCSVILSFNISDEVFETIELPNNEAIGTIEKLLVLHNSLALIVFIGRQTYEQENKFDVWKLKENNGVAKSWIKVSTIVPSNFSPGRFLGFFEDSIAVIGDTEERLMMLYNLETHGTEIEWTRNYDDDGNSLSRMFLMHFYVESLFSINGGGRLTTPSSLHKLACDDGILSVLKHV